MSEQGRSGEASRYKEAATDALTLLDWCIEYLASNGHRRVAKRLVRGRNHVHERLTRRARG
jgi:hypothetical protein